MIRTQIYITAQERDALMRLTSETNKSQSELIRDAIDALIERFSANQKQVLNEAAGMWAGRKDIPPLKKLRDSWERHH